MAKIVYSLSLDPDADADVIQFLEQQRNKSAVFRRAVRLLMDESENKHLLQREIAQTLDEIREQIKEITTNERVIVVRNTDREEEDGTGRIVPVMNKGDSGIDALRASVHATDDRRQRNSARSSVDESQDRFQEAIKNLDNLGE